MIEPPIIPYGKRRPRWRARLWFAAVALALVVAPVTIGHVKRVADERRREARIRNDVASRFQAAVERTRLVVEHGEAIDLGRGHVSLDQARLARFSNATLFSDATLASFDERIAELDTALDALSTRLGREQSGRYDARMTQRDGCIGTDTLYRTTLRLILNGRFGEAVGVVDQIIVLDTADVRARALRPMVAAAMRVQAVFRDVASLAARLNSDQAGRPDEAEAREMAELRSQIARAECFCGGSRSETIAHLRALAGQLILKGDLTAAVGVLDQLLVLEPEDDISIRAMRRMLGTVTGS